MQRLYELIVIERDGEVFCVRLKNARVADDQMENLGAELGRVVDADGCRQMVLCLGPEEPDCLISIFLAKMINLQRRLEGIGGAFALAEVSEYTRNIFRIAGIERFFHIYPDQASAVQALSKPND